MGEKGNFAYMASLFTPLGVFYMPQIYDIYQSTLRNISEEQRCNLKSGGSPKSRKVHSSFNFQSSSVDTI